MTVVPFVPTIAALGGSSVTGERVLVRGRVVDPLGRPIAGADVFGAPPCGVPRQEWNLIPFESRRPERCPGFARGTSGPDGTFELSVERGEELHVALRGRGRVGLDLLREVAADIAELDLGVSTLEGGAVVSGTVVDEAGVPISGAEIARYGETDFTDRTRIDWSEVVLATSAPGGTFRLDTLAPGRTALEVRAAGFVRARRAVHAADPAGGEWRVVLERASPITGRVVGAPADAELGVYFWIQSLHEQHHVPCGPDGSFTIDGLSARLARLDLYAVRRRAPATGIDLGAIAFPDWERISPSVPVRPGMRDVELRVPATVTYRFRVLDARTGQPLSDVRVGMLAGLDIETPLPAGAHAERSGVHEVTLLLPWIDGSRALAVSRSGYGRIAVGELPYTPGATQDLGTVALVPLDPTRVRIVSCIDGRPLEGALVSAAIEVNDEGCLNAHMVGTWPARSALPGAWNGSTAADGTATAYLTPGRPHWIGVQHPDHARLWHHLVVEGSPPEHLELRLVAGGTLHVRCLDARTLSPLAGEAVVYETNDSYRRLEVTTGADGRARVDHLAPGSYRIWARRDRERHATTAEVEDGGSVEVTLVVDTP